VTAVGTPARIVPMGGEGLIPAWRNLVLHPSPPVAAIRALAPGAEVRFVDSRYPSAAAAAAANADVAIVFATQWMLEHYDAPDLSLPSGQDDVIRAVAAANRNTVVVLQTGGPVLMPWLAATPAVVAAWYPGQQGGAAIGNVLFGVAEPAGRLPLTFPAREADLPRPAIPGIELPDGRPFAVDYTEGADVGYRWFARRGIAPAFPFGYGLSYTTFRYGGLAVSGTHDVRAEFDVTNTGARAGWVVPQVYLTAARGAPERRLLGWSKALLGPGETKHFSVAVDARLLAEFDTAGHRWSIAAGDYEIALGDSAETFAARRTQRLSARTLPP
jgi:beta-glucosidase